MSFDLSVALHPGEIWLDSDGNRIQAHGGGMLLVGDTYYWYGEQRDGDTIRDQDTPDGRVDTIGVSCYSSRDLQRWTYEGIVLSPEQDDPAHERPKVLYNAATRTYVLWAHIDKDRYVYARTGVAISKSPTGPFVYLGSFRPNGCESRDMTVFADDDGSAYLFYSSEGNATLHISRLSEDYLSVSETFSRQFEGKYREAPALCKCDGRYYLVTSGCTGWNPNAAEYAEADHPLGDWLVKGNPCIGTEVEQAMTFESQSSFILPIPDRPNDFLFLGDRWNQYDLRDSRYIWLPMTIRDGVMSIRWTT
jgi:hypothetical protein